MQRSSTLGNPRKGTRLAWGLGASLFLCGVSGLAADRVDDATRSTARALGYAGVEAYQAGDYQGASVKLDKSYLVLKAPSLGLWSARALIKLGKLVEASERLREVTRLEVAGGEVDVQKQAKLDAAAELNELTPAIPALVVQVDGAPASEIVVAIDGATIPSELIGERRPVNPGLHKLEGRRGTGERVAADATVARAEQKTVVLHFGASPPGPSSDAAAGAGAAGSGAATGLPAAAGPSVATGSGVASPSLQSDAAPTSSRSSVRTVGWIALGVGAAGLGTSAVTALLAKKKDPGCGDSNTCGSQFAGPVGDYNSLRTVSTVSFWAGAVLGVGGAVVLLTAPRSNRVAFGIGPGSATVSGSF